MTIEKVKICATNLYEPHVTDYKNNMTYVEYLMGILKKLNETIAQVNQNSEFIAEFDSKYADLTERIVALEIAVNEGLPNYIDDTLSRAISQIRTEVQGAIAASEARLNATLQVQVERLDTRIDNVAIGKINVIDPTTGISSPLQTVIDNLFGASRENALTAQEYDSLELTATAYDSFNIEAYDYDLNGKTILMA